METIILALGAAGMALIITRSKLFEAVRMIWRTEMMATLFSCPQCMGFWCGVALSLTFFSWLNLLTVPFIASGIGYIITMNE